MELSALTRRNGILLAAAFVTAVAVLLLFALVGSSSQVTAHAATHHKAAHHVARHRANHRARHAQTATDTDNVQDQSAAPDSGSGESASPEGESTSAETDGPNGHADTAGSSDHQCPPSCASGEQG